jgi:hypothetical protein
VNVADQSVESRYWNSVVANGMLDLKMENILTSAPMYFVLRHQKPKQQKTLEKRKNHCVFFWNGIVVGGYAKSTSVQEGQRQQSNVHREEDSES